MDQAELDNRFNYHTPDELRVRTHQAIRDRCAALAHVFNNACPEGREKALALVKLEEAMFWANASIARNDG